ncbi:MAG: hypothetical protein R3C99_19305 [Pirellulaceae bacterium]|nr:hypothetical protein [Planctomycetales bacterium]MCA9165195.1 hypothetical protein [Planctomycetales bacterium]MCA9210141.1 hypothetical protein [Planctomycetales bacterium]MCA9219012.1 hypothetical protein [Planctomycetales bacterium]MCA9228785.1 hypothetical protein [Planctomycetales bacterium]
MKRFALLMAAAVIAGWFAAPAQAFPPFKAAFTERYVDKSDNEGFKAAAKEASCNVCHVKDEKKSVQNEYGHALHEELEKSGEKPKELMKSDKEKLLKLLDEAFTAVEKEKSKGGKTFGELIKSGMLPAGN